MTRTPSVGGEQNEALRQYHAELDQYQRDYAAYLDDYYNRYLPELRAYREAQRNERSSRGLLRLLRFAVPSILAISGVSSAIDRSDSERTYAAEED